MSWQLVRGDYTACIFGMAPPSGRMNLRSSVFARLSPFLFSAPEKRNLFLLMSVSRLLCRIAEAFRSCTRGGEKHNSCSSGSPLVFSQCAVCESVYVSVCVFVCVLFFSFLPLHSSPPQVFFPKLCFLPKEQKKAVHSFFLCLVLYQRIRRTTHFCSGPTVQREEA